jgi:hypothetical protein
MTTEPAEGNLTRDFALLNSRSSAVVLDGDEARAFLTRWLLHELAPALGLDPAKIEIRVNAEAAARTDAAGANGLADGGTVFLNPSRYSPETGSGRHLLAHEVSHLAQSARPGRGPIETLSSRQCAEQEADRVASAFEAGERIPKLDIGIALAVAPAADTDFDAKLAKAVVTGRAREIDAIKRLLSGLWISDGDVFDVFKILESMPFAVARAVVQTLGKKPRYELCDNINTVHLKRNRSIVFACYDALDDDQFDAVDTSVLEEGPMDGLTGEERDAAVRTIRNLTTNQQRDLLRSGNGYQTNKLFLSSGDHALSSAEIEERAKKQADLLKGEQDLAVQREKIAMLRESQETKSILEQLRAILNDGKSSPLLNAQRAVEALAVFSGPQLTALAEQLDAEGLIDLIFAHLPEWAFFGENAHTETLIELMRARLPSKNLDYVESLLSYGFFDWAVRDYEAEFAYRVLKLLPLEAQYRFRQRDNGKWFMRLVQNLPEEFTRAKDYAGDIEVKKATKEEIEQLKRQGVTALDEKELLVDVAAVHKNRLEAGGGQSILAQIEKLKKDFEDAAKSDTPRPAYEALHRQIALVGSAALEGGTFRAADQLQMEIVVHELDRAGYIDKLFDELSDEFLYHEANRITTVKIMMARDPARVQYHARELVSRGFTDWMVNDREAYLAYLCVKALPEVE